MQIKSLGENSFYILLSDEDMNELGISFEDLDYSNIETRRVIWTLLEEARNRLNRDIDPRSRMLIEVSQRETGCKIEFTLGKSESAGRLKIKKESPFVAAFFKNTEALFLFAERQKDLTSDAELYSYSNGLALVLSASPCERERLRFLLGEYSRLLPDSLLFTQSVREHGKLIFQGKLTRLLP